MMYVKLQNYKWCSGLQHCSTGYLSTSVTAHMTTILHFIKRTFNSILFTNFVILSYLQSAVFIPESLHLLSNMEGNIWS